MSIRETIRTIVAEGMRMSVPEVVPRDVDLARVNGRASVIVGPRRCGKTYRMYQRARELLDDGVPRSHMIFVDFEDDRMFPGDEHLIANVVDEYIAALAMEGDKACEGDGKLYLFLDEVHNVPEWGRQLRRLLGNARLEICVTGSSAKMLSTEIATEFKGRGVTTEMFPLSFREYLRFQGKEELGRNPVGSEQAELVREFEDYVRIGGFPEAQGLESRLRVRIQQDLVDVVIARDICERHNLPVRGVSAFVRQALRTSGREFSVGKIYHSLRSAQVPLARDVAYALPGYCEDAYLFFTIAQLTRSYKTQSQGVRKLYSVDPGLQFALSPAASQDLGQRFEDAVFMHLRSRNAGLRDGAIALYRSANAKEVDFVIGDAAEEQPYALMQVAVEIEDAATAKREYGSLSQALDETGLREGRVVVFNAPSCIQPDDERIQLISAWDWFLSR